MGQDAAIGRYIDSARIRNFTAKTIQRKQREIARFRWWLDDEGMASSLAAITTRQRASIGASSRTSRSAA